MILFMQTVFAGAVVVVVCVAVLSYFVENKMNESMKRDKPSQMLD